MITGATWVIAKKEILETLRDHRTLLSMILIPVVFYPAMIFLMTQVASVQMARMEQESGTLGFVEAQAPPVLLRAFDDTERVEIHELGTSHTRKDLAEGTLDVLVQVSDDFSAQWNELGTGKITLLFDETSERSRILVDRLEGKLNDLKEDKLQQRLKELQVATEAIVPVKWQIENIAPPARMGGYLLGKILPLFLILAIVLGAFYPAVDLTAGEKERGTLQSLLTAPVSVNDIIAGKFIAVASITLLAGAINLGSISLFFGQTAILGEMPMGIHLELNSHMVVLLSCSIVALALFFSALLMTVAVLARSFKEAQAYLTPVYLACLIPAMMAQLPGMELSTWSAWVPGMNLTLGIQSILLESFRPTELLIAIGSTLLYTAIILRIASSLFRREAVMLGEKSGLHALASSQPSGQSLKTPSFGETLSLYGVVFILVLYGGSFFQSFSLGAGILLTPFILVLGTTWLWSHFRSWDFRRTFLWLEPKGISWVSAVMLGLGSWALVLPLVAWMNDTFLPMPEEMIAKAQELLSMDRPLWEIIAIDLGITFGAGFCEEFLFRGAILSGARKSMPTWVAVLITALLFAVLHLSIHRLAGTFLLGIVAGCIAVWSGSIFPAMLYHTTHNALVLSMGKVSTDASEDVFPVWALALGATVSFIGGWLLYQSYVRSTQEQREEESLS
jgi:sodium transport system permease protein